jgi:hypothetical protein
MGSILSVVGPVAVLLVIVFGGAAIAKSLFGSGHTSDGDTVKNRLEGRGPNDQPWDHPGSGDGPGGAGGWAEDGER